MKITHAKCSLNADGMSGAYVAFVKVQSDGKETDGIEYGDSPHSALHRAFGVALEKHARPAYDALQVGIEVKF